MARGKDSGARVEGGLIDTHVFVISPYFLRHNFLPSEIDATLDTLVADMDAVGVEVAIGTMFVTHEDDLVGSVPQGLSRHRKRVAAQLCLQPNRPEWSASNIRAAAANPSVVGVRAMLSVFRMRPDDQRLSAVFEACEQSRLPVQLVFDASSYSAPEAFRALATSFPDLRLVLSVARNRNRAALKALLSHPHVYAQLPGLLDAEAGDGDAAFLRWAARTLPPDKLMFGSDRLGRERDYEAKVRALNALDAGARASISRGTALAVYGARLERALA